MVQVELLSYAMKLIMILLVLFSTGFTAGFELHPHLFGSCTGYVALLHGIPISSDPSNNIISVEVADKFIRDLRCWTKIVIARARGNPCQEWLFSVDIISRTMVYVSLVGTNNLPASLAFCIRYCTGTRV